MSDDPPVAVVLDTSALLAHAAGSVAVGELVAEVSDEHRIIGVPATCLAQAHAATSDQFGATQLLLLTAATQVAILPLAADDVWPVGQLAREVDGDIPLAHAVYLAAEHRAYYVTADPARAVAVLPSDWPILDVG